MSLFELLMLAQRYARLNPSAAFCERQAFDAYQEHKRVAAAMWALKSLKHSVGIFHPAYQNAEEAWGPASSAVGGNR